MSDITVTQDNLSRFTKRLQKALQEQFNQKIPLNIASNLFAKSCGKINEAELKEVLKINSINNNLDKKIKELNDKSDELIELDEFDNEEVYENSKKAVVIKDNPMNHAMMFIGEVCNFLQGQKSILKSSFYMDAKADLFLIVHSEKISSPEINIKNHYDIPIANFNKDLLVEIFYHCDYKPNDKTAFLEILTKYLINEDGSNAMNEDVLDKIKQILKLKPNQTHLINNLLTDVSKTIYIDKYGSFVEKFIIVPNHYFEKVGAEKAFDGHTWIMIKKENYPFYHTIEDAYDALKDNEMLMQYAVDKINHKQGFCSYCILQRDNLTMVKSMPYNYDSFGFVINSKDQLLSFEGFQDMRLNKNKINPYGINEKNYIFWKKGYAGDLFNFEKD